MRRSREKGMGWRKRGETCWQGSCWYLLVSLLLSALLLQACSNETARQVGRNGLSGRAPTPVISPFLQQQGNTDLQAFQQWITLMKQNGGDTATYQQQADSARQALSHARTVKQYNDVLQTIQTQTQAIKIPAMEQEVQYLRQHLRQEVSTWGTQHQFRDTYDGQTYSQDYAYDNQNGVGGPLWLQEDVEAEQTLADYQQTVKDLSIWLYNFQEMAANFEDKTPSNQSHKADIDLLQHYGLMNERVVVVSLSEQALRAYDHGQLIKAFQVTTGQPSLPTPPGTWAIENKLHPTIFKSSAPPGSTEWYPDTPITYAMQYHENGYFLHDAWWRTQFGPGSNYPHQDPDGDPFAGQGSHGCINMSTDDAAWMYQFVSIATHVIIY